MTGPPRRRDAPALLYGDPHGEWRPLLRAIREEQPHAVIILGDCDLRRPLHEELREAFAAGVSIWWILGNHDCDSAAAWTNLAADHPGGALGGRSCLAAGHVAAGLDGVFRGQVWYPMQGDEAPLLPDRAALLRAQPRGSRFRGGVPLHLRDAILPEDLQALRRLRADILVTHEAPTSHRHGFGALDNLARDMGARLLVHGHHHASCEGTTRHGCRVRGLGRAEVMVLRPGALER